MIECPNCGIENPPTRAFCRVCAERLPSDRVVPTLDAEPSPAPEQPPVPEPEQPATEPQDRPPPAPAPNPNLPAWLQGTEIDAAAEETVDTFEWEEDLDFSGLPEWDSDSKVWEDTPTEEPRAIGTWLPFGPEDPIQSAESVGSGLLAGVRGPIPVEPIVRLPHHAPRLPERLTARDSEGAELFAQIAAGTIVPSPPAVPAASPRRGSRLLPLLLLLAVVVPLLLPRLALFGRPPLLPSVVAYRETLEALPPQSTVLLAFDYEGGMRDEVEPAALATLDGLRALAEEEGREMTLIAVSTTPQGPALAEHAWQEAVGTSEAMVWQNAGYLSGGVVAVRALFPPEEALGPALLIVLGDESSDVQQWVEQAGLIRPVLPLLAVAPAISEAALQPYLASGQLDGLLAGVPAAASFESYYLDEGGAGVRRMDALSLGALLLLGVILAGNLAALGGRVRRRGKGTAQ